MSHAIERAKAHFHKLTGAGRKSIAVPEWADETGAPLMIYWKPLTLLELARLLPGGKRPTPPDLAAVLCVKAEDDKGAALFPDPTDQHFLCSAADQSIIKRIADAILGGDTVEEAAKNS